MNTNGTGAETRLLSLRGITKEYPGVLALDDVSVDFHAGEVHAIIGENGAGKSTLIKVIAGAIQPNAGVVEVAGTALDTVSPQISRAHGIEVIYQEFNLVPTLSVAENIFLGQGDGWRVDYRGMREMAAELLADFGVDIDPDALTRDLPSAQQQLVEIAKALAKKPRVLIMDEPTAPLSLREVESLFSIIRRARADGVCVLYVSHRLEEIFQITDRVTVLRDGQYVTTVETAATDKGTLIRFMVGRELTHSYPARKGPPGAVALEAKGLEGNGNAPISFTLHKGEILGVAGLVGAGRTELAKLIYGAAHREGGNLLLEGREVHFTSPRQALNAGIGLVPESRKEEGVFLEKTIKWNVAIAALNRLTRGILVDRSREQEEAEAYRDKLMIKTPTLEQKVSNLSGGNQQKVVIAKTLAAQARVIIFDEPTRGIDVGARAEVYDLMNDLAAEGIAILMISSDMEELLGMSDHILVLHDGRKAGDLTRAEATQERVLALASGLNESKAA